MSDYRTLNRTVLAKLEGTAGQDASPVVGTDAVLVEDPTIAGLPESLETNEVTGSLDPRAPITGGGGRTWNGTVILKGTSNPASEPEYQPLLQACGFAQEGRGVDETGTAQSATASTIVVAVGDGANADIGDIIETTGGTGSGQTRVVTGISTDTLSIYPDWAVTPDGTTTYALRARVLWTPESTSLDTITIYDYLHATPAAQDSRLRKILGAAGTCQFTFPNRGLPRAAFSFQGKFVTPTDVSHPGAAAYSTLRPVAFMGADIYLNGVQTKLNTLTFDIGNNVQQADDPADTFGVDVGGITRRRMTGRLNPPMALLSERNVIADFLAGTARKLWWRWGTVGNGVSFYVPQAIYTGSEDEDVNGFAHEGIPFAAQGDNAGVYICAY